MRRTQSSRVPTYQGWIASKEGHGLEPTGLVRTANQIEVCACKELGHHVLAEREAHAAITLTPATNASDLRIRPQQVAQQTRVRNLRRARDSPQLLKALQFWRKAGVYTEDLLLHDRAEGETVKNLVEQLPHPDVVPSLA